MMDWNWIKDNCKTIVRNSKTYIELTPEIYNRIYLKLGNSKEAIGRRLCEHVGLDYDMLYSEEGKE